MLPHLCTSFTPAWPCRAPKSSGCVSWAQGSACFRGSPHWRLSDEAGNAARTSPGKDAVGVTVTAPAGLTCILKNKMKKPRVTPVKRSHPRSPYELAAAGLGFCFGLLCGVFQTLKNLSCFINYPGFFVFVLLVPPSSPGTAHKGKYLLFSKLIFIIP